MIKISNKKIWTVPKLQIVVQVTKTMFADETQYIYLGMLLLLFSNGGPIY